MFHLCGILPVVKTCAGTEIHKAQYPQLTQKNKPDLPQLIWKTRFMVYDFKQLRKVASCCWCSWLFVVVVVVVVADYVLVPGPLPSLPFLLLVITVTITINSNPSYKAWRCCAAVERLSVTTAHSSHRFAGSFRGWIKNDGIMIFH